MLGTDDHTQNNASAQEYTYFFGATGSEFLLVTGGSPLTHDSVRLYAGLHELRPLDVTLFSGVDDTTGDFMLGLRTADGLCFYEVFGPNQIDPKQRYWHNSAVASLPVGSYGFHPQPDGSIRVQARSC